MLRISEGLTAASGAASFPAHHRDRTHTHTHPRTKHHPPARKQLFDMPSLPLGAFLCLELCQFLLFCVFLRSVLPPGAALLPSLALLFVSLHSLPLTLFPLCARLSKELKNTHLSNTGSSSRRGSSSPVAKYEELWSKQVPRGSPGGSQESDLLLIFFFYWRRTQQLVSVVALVCPFFHW